MNNLYLLVLANFVFVSAIYRIKLSVVSILLKNAIAKKNHPQWRSVKNLDKLGRYFLCLILITGSLTSQRAFSQSTIVNYNFNSGASFAALAPTLATNITSTPTGSAAFASAATGVVSGASAFTANATAGNYLSTAASNSWTFTLGGTNLQYYKTFKVYFQAQRSGGSSNTITLSYNANGAGFVSTGITNSGVLTLGTNTTWFEGLFTIPVGADNPTSLAFKLTTGSTATVRIDNFQVQAEPAVQVSDISGNTICSGANGQLTATISGGTSPYTIVYNDGTANRTATGVISGTAFNVNTNPTTTTNYTLVSITDANSLTRTAGFTDAAATITVNASPTALATASLSSICLGGTVSLSSSGSSNVSTTVNYPVTPGTTAIPNNSSTGLSSTVTASGLPTAISSLSNISVTVNITHSNDADIELYLIAPGGSISNTANGSYMNTTVSGQSIALTADQGGTGNNFTTTVFSDAGTNTIATSGAPVPFTGTFKPDQAFSTLSGDPNGVWTLKAVDDAGGSAGTLNSWTITFTYSNGVTYTWSSTPAGFTSSIQNPGTVTPSPIVSTNYIVAVTDNGNGCTTYSTATVNVKNPPTTADAGLDQTDALTCGLTQVTLSANTPTDGTGAWSIVSGTGGSFGNTANPSSTFSGVAGNTYTLRWTISNSPCTASTDDVVITFNRNPTAAAGPDQTGVATCGLTQVTLAATAPTVGIGAWSVVSGTGGSFGNLSSNTSTFSGIAGNAYTLRWTVTNAPCGVATDDVVIVFNAAPTTANAGPDQTSAATCGLTQVTLAANTPTLGTGAWSLVSGTGGSFGNTSSSASTFSGVAGNTYTLRWTTTNGLCTTTDDVVITFNRQPSTSAAGPDQTGVSTCGLTQVTLAATTPTIGTGAWSIVSGTGGSFGNTSSATSTFSGTAGNTYTLRWTVSNSPCTASTDDVVIKFNRNPTAAAGPDQTGTTTCGLTQVTLAATTPTVGTGSWSIVSGTGGSFGNVSSPTSTFSGLAGNSYTLRWTVTNSPCTVTATDDVNITFNALPTASITANYCMNGGGVELTAGLASTYLWSDGITTRKDTVDLAGEYSVTVTNAVGCTNTAFYTVSQELVVNGNFSAGNTGFSSSYTNKQAFLSADGIGLTPEGYYAVNTDASQYHNNFFGTDHTSPGAGNFMIVNGFPNVPGVKVWYETVTIAPNTTYYFSAWALSMNNVNPQAQLQFAVNDSTIGTTAVLTPNTRTSPPFGWVRFYGTWTSGPTATTVEISIIDKQTAPGGNDFGIDDISCSTLSPVTFSVNPSGGGVPLCAGNTLNLTANLSGGTSPFTYSWTGPAGSGFTSTAANPSINNITTANSGNYVLSIVDGYGCTTNATAPVTVNFVPTDKTTSVASSIICAGTSTNIQVASSQTGVTYQLRDDADNSAVGGSVVGTGGTISLPTGNLTNTTTFNVLATTTGATCNIQLGGTQTVTVNPAPTLTGASQAAGVCNGSAAQINLTGLLSNVTSTITYKINGGATQTVTNVVSNAAGAASFTTIALATINNGQTLQITSVATTSTTPSCSKTFTTNVTLIVGTTTLTAVSQPTSVCVGSSAQINLTGLVNNSTSTITYTINGGSTQTVNGVVASGTGTASFNTLSSLTAANNGQTLSVTSVTNTSATPGCTTNFTTKTTALAVNPTPTLTGASQAATVCDGSAVQINLTGLIASSTSTITYTINGGATQTVTGVVANVSGAANFSTGALTYANNGQILQITGVTRTNVIPNCTQTFAQNVTLALQPTPTLTGASQAAGVCNGSTAQINLTGLLSNVTSTITYKINGGATQTVTNVVSNASGAASFTTVALVTANNNQTLQITSIATTSTTPSCSKTFTTNVTLIVGATTLTTAAQVSSVCSNSVAQINLTGLVANSTSTITYTVNGGATQTVTGVVANVSGVANFNTLAGLTTANNGQTLSVTSVTNTSASPGCTTNFTTKTTTLTVNPTPTLGGASQSATVCGNTSAQISLTGLLSNSTSTITYTINGGSTQTVTGVVADASGSASFSTIPLSGSNDGKILQITGVTNTSASPNCSQAFTQNVTLSVSVPTLNAITMTSVCSGSSAQISLTGLSPNSISTIDYTVDHGSTLTANGVTADASGAASFNSIILNSNEDGDDLIVTTVTNALGCSQTFSKKAIVSVTQNGTWLGANSVWNNPLNWCGGVPTSTTDVYIPNTVSNFPVLSTGVGTAHNITIQSGASLINTAKLQIYGAITNNGTFDATSGTIEMKGTSAQTIAGSMFVDKKINQLMISNTNAGGVTVTNLVPGDSLKIVDAISFGNVNNAKLYSTDNIALLSTNTKTARIADVTNGGVNSHDTIIGKITVERFLPMQVSSVSRRWRLLTAPIKSIEAPTLNAAWQEGAVNSSVALPINPKPGYGTQITNGNTAAAVANGFDMGSTSSPSIYYMNPGPSATWVVPSNTSQSFASQEGYMVFVRGDRSIYISNQFVSANPTTLEVKGNMNIGDVTKTLVTGKQVIGNPYASAISFDNVEMNGATFNDAGHSFYHWDPKTSGSFSVGRFITVTNDGVGFPSSYTVTTNQSGISDGTIESGAAIVVISSGGSNKLTFHETDKLVTSSTTGIASRPMGNSNLANLSKLYTNLYWVNPDGSKVVADGVANTYYPNYNNNVDEYDAAELISFNSKENLSIARDGKLLSVEKRKRLTISDTIFLELRSMNNMNYRFEFNAKNIAPGLRGYLIDTYTSTETPIDLQQQESGTYDFTINNNIPASANIGRFYIVFRPAVEAGPLPVKIVSVNATQQNTAIAIDWKVANEVNIQKYIVEHSTDGIHFTQMSVVTANETSLSFNYTTLDKNPANGLNYYRVTSVDKIGVVTYSSIIKVMYGNHTPSINVYPSVVTNGIVGISLTDMPKDKYHVRVLNSIGQLVITRDIDYSGGTMNTDLLINQALSNGVYQIDIVGTDKKHNSFKIIKQ